MLEPIENLLPGISEVYLAAGCMAERILKETRRECMSGEQRLKGCRGNLDINCSDDNRRIGRTQSVWLGRASRLD
jgi:hypothetical protein